MWQTSSERATGPRHSLHCAWGVVAGAGARALEALGARPPEHICNSAEVILEDISIGKYAWGEMCSPLSHAATGWAGALQDKEYGGLLGRLWNVGSTATRRRGVD